MPRSPDHLVQAQQHRANENTARRLRERNAGVTFQQPDDWDAWWATYDPAEAEQRQQETWDNMQREVATTPKPSCHAGSWHPFTKHIRRFVISPLPIMAPRLSRATRTGRTNTARRTASMAGSASSGGGDGGSDSDPPSSPAARAAEGRAKEEVG